MDLHTMRRVPTRCHLKMKLQLSLAQMQLLRKSKKLVDEETRSIVRQMSAEFRQLPNLRSTSLSIH
jgi:hypothetical protein